MNFFWKKLEVAAPLLLLFFFSKCQSEPFSEGKNLYKTHCQNCHAENGEGLAGLIPPLAGADFLEKNRAKLPCILTKGMAGEVLVNGKIYSENMPGVPKLTAVEVTNILNFIGGSWGNQSAVWKVEEVKLALDNCQ